MGELSPCKSTLRTTERYPPTCTSDRRVGRHSGMPYEVKPRMSSCRKQEDSKTTPVTESTWPGGELLPNNEGSRWKSVVPGA
ncbi:hypothetical protein KM043_002279 [Ampulex compressa]|nr:hypothetical protein KM043_002279 [Ampulex compressa]